MGALIDADVLIAHERKRLPLADLVRGREQETMGISVITASELLHGYWRATDPDVRERRRLFVEGVLRDMPVLPIDLEIARVHAKVSAELAAHGQMIGAHDAWVAATCLVQNWTLVTRNEGEFRRVPGLKVETWAG